MKKGCSPRKKYANGTGNTGIGPSNYIQDPAEALADYNIMLAKADQEALSNPWLPIVSTVGALGSQLVSAGAFGSATPKTVTPKAANGMNSVEEDVELEGGEMIETPQGQVEEIEGPSHEQGGVPMEVNQDIPEGTKVYSDRLKIGNKTLAERKATRERQMANIEKSISGGADLAVKNAAQRRVKAIEAEEASDLQFQEQVNNMLEMTKSVMKAFGTGMQGVQKYAYGSDEEGIDPPFKKDIPNSADYETNIIKNIQKAIGAFPDGDWGSKSNLAMRNWQKTNLPEDYKANVKNFGKDFSFSSEDINILYDPKNGKKFKKMAGLTPEAYKYIGPDIPEVPKYTPPGSSLPPAVPEGGVLANMEKAYQESKAAEKEATVEFDSTTLLSGLPGVGDITKLVGNYMGATAGLKNAAEQRSTDIAHKNEFANVGKESLKNINTAQSAIEGQKAAAIVKATSQNRAGKRGGRSSARGINQSRAMDWLYDTALNQTVAEITANAGKQSADLELQKSNVNMQSDIYKGEGAKYAALANEKAKDAYYNAKGMGRKDLASGIQQTGKDLNAMKQNEIYENLLKQIGKLVTISPEGIVTARKTKNKK